MQFIKLLFNREDRSKFQKYFDDRIRQQEKHTFQLEYGTCKTNLSKSEPKKQNVVSILQYSHRFYLGFSFSICNHSISSFRFTSLSS